MFIKLTAIKKLDNVLKDKLEFERPCSTLVPISRIEYIMEGEGGTVVELGNNSVTLLVTESVVEIERLLVVERRKLKGVE